MKGYSASLMHFLLWGRIQRPACRRRSPRAAGRYHLRMGPAERKLLRIIITMLVLFVILFVLLVTTPVEWLVKVF